MAKRITDERVLKERVIKMLPKGAPADAIAAVECDPYDSVNKDFGPSYWVYLNAGWICPEMEGHTIHEDTLSDLRPMLKQVREWPDDPQLIIEDHYYTPSSTAGDYGPSNPWEAPGMSVSDFI